MKFADQALERLAKVVGQEKAAAIRAQALSAIGLEALVSPQDVLHFADALIPQGGIVEAIGRAMKVQALLRGAIEAPSTIARAG